MNEFTRKIWFLDKNYEHLKERTEDCQILCLISNFEILKLWLFRNRCSIYCAVFVTYDVKGFLSWSHNFLLDEVLLYWTRMCLIKWFGGDFFFVCT